MSYYCTLLSQTFYGLLLSYLTITDVTSYVQFLSCCTSQPKNKKQNHYCKQFYECSYLKKITLARFACLCFFFDKAIAASINREWLKWLIKCWKLLLHLKSPLPLLIRTTTLNVITLIRFFRIRCTVT